MSTGLCLKTFKLLANEKFFINICQSDGIPPPENIDRAQLLEICESEMESSYRVPMSISELRTINEQTVCDVAINPLFFEKIRVEELFRDFLITIIFEAMDTKYNVQLDVATKIILKNRTHWGTLVKHRIQKRDVKRVYESYQNQSSDTKALIDGLTNGTNKKSKLIEEVVENPSAVTGIQKNNITAQEKPKVQPIQYSMVTTGIRIFAEFYLPQVKSAKEVELHIGEDRIEVTVPSRGYSMGGCVAETIDVDRITAEFNVNKSVSIYYLIFATKHSF